MLLALLAQADTSTDVSPAAAAGAGIVSLIFLVVMLAVVLFPVYVIAKKAGYNPLLGVLVAFVPIWNLMWLYKIYQRIGQNGWLCLLQLVGPVGIVMLYILAFSKWPAGTQAVTA